MFCTLHIFICRLRNAGLYYIYKRLRPAARSKERAENILELQTRKTRFDDCLGQRVKSVVVHRCDFHSQALSVYKADLRKHCNRIAAGDVSDREVVFASFWFGSERYYKTRIEIEFGDYDHTGRVNSSLLPSCS